MLFISIAIAPTDLLFLLRDVTSLRLLSDFNKEVIRAYDVMYEEYNYGMKGVAKRAVYVIDGEGIIRHIEVLEKAGQMPDLEATKEAIRSLAVA